MGVRRAPLETRVLGVDVWSVYTDLDSCFERIADGGAERLRRSV